MVMKTKIAIRPGSKGKQRVYEEGSKKRSEKILKKLFRIPRNNLS